jgi:GT2 family glycosyltransferase
MLDLSIVIPTVNRAESLKACLAALRESTGQNYEVIVVDGASSDGTARILAEARGEFGERLSVITEQCREGFVRAANKGFRVARGRYLTWLNDDARPLPGSLDRAVECVRGTSHRVGLAAMFHSTPVLGNVAVAVSHHGRTYHVLHVRGTLYANFGLGSRELFERLGYLDERYFLNAADPDFSLKVWDAGFSVAPAFGALIDHDEIADHRRNADVNCGAADNAKLFAKWDLPDRHPRQVFDRLRPCTSAGLRRDLRRAI